MNQREDDLRSGLSRFLSDRWAVATELEAMSRIPGGASRETWKGVARSEGAARGIIVRIDDDLMSALEKIVMMKRAARPVPLGSKVIKRRPGLVATGTEDEDYWGV